MVHDKRIRSAPTNLTERYPTEYADNNEFSYIGVLTIVLSRVQLNKVLSLALN